MKKVLIVLFVLTSLFATAQNKTAVSDIGIKSVVAGASDSLKTAKDSLTALSSRKRDTRVPLDTIVNDSYATSLSSVYSSAGSATFSFTGGVLQVSGGSGFASFANKYTRVWNTALNKYSLIADLTGSVDGAGVAIGFSNTYAFIDMSAGGTRGQIKIMNDSSTTGAVLATSATNLSFTNGDRIRLTLTRFKNVITITATNVASGASTVSASYYQTLLASNKVLQGGTKFAIYAIGGTQNFYSLKYVGNAAKNASFLVLGDSNAEGWYNGTYDDSWPMLLEQSTTDFVETEARQGLIVTDLINCIPEIKLFNRNKVIVSIGTNDVVAGSSFSTITTALKRLNDSLIVNGLSVILCHIIPNNTSRSTVIDQVNYWMDTSGYYTIRTNYPLRNIAALRTDYASDSTHMNSLGAAIFASAVKNKLDSTGVYSFSKNYFDRTVKATVSPGNYAYAFLDYVYGTTLARGYIFAPTLWTSSGSQYGVEINPNFIGTSTTRNGLKVTNSVLRVGSSGATNTVPVLDIDNGTTADVGALQSNVSGGVGGRLNLNNFGTAGTSNRSELKSNLLNSGGSAKGPSVRFGLTNITALSEVSIIDFWGYNSSATAASMANLTGNNLAVGGNVTAAKFALSALNTAPSSSTDTGTAGEIRFDANYIYLCTATNTWVRSPLTTW